MPQSTNKFDFKSEELKAKYLKEIICFFHDERDEEIGLIAAEQLLEFFTRTMGEEIYNMAISDCKKLLKEKAQDLEVELDILGSNN